MLLRQSRQDLCKQQLKEGGIPPRTVPTVLSTPATGSAATPIQSVRPVLPGSGEMEPGTSRGNLLPLMSEVCLLCRICVILVIDHQLCGECEALGKPVPVAGHACIKSHHLEETMMHVRHSEEAAFEPHIII
jgi:hypothetical protein